MRKIKNEIKEKTFPITKEASSAKILKSIQLYELF